jgi:hypothetical protein
MQLLKLFNLFATAGTLFAVRAWTRFNAHAPRALLGSGNGAETQTRFGGSSSNSQA